MITVYKREPYNTTRLQTHDFVCNFVTFNVSYKSEEVNLHDTSNFPTTQYDKVKFKIYKPVIKRALMSPIYFGAQLREILPKETQFNASFPVHL